jgi:hypothetical protein
MKDSKAKAFEKVVEFFKLKICFQNEEIFIFEKDLPKGLKILQNLNTKWFNMFKF